MTLRIVSGWRRRRKEEAVSKRLVFAVCLALLLLLVLAVPALATPIRPTHDIVLQDYVQPNLAAGTPWNIGADIQLFGQGHSKAP